MENVVSEDGNKEENAFKNKVLVHLNLKCQNNLLICITIYSLILILVSGGTNKCTVYMKSVRTLELNTVLMPVIIRTQFQIKNTNIISSLKNTAGNSRLKNACTLIN